MKSNQQESRSEQRPDEKGQQEVDLALENSSASHEDSSDVSSNHDSVGGTSVDEDLIVSAGAVAAAAQTQVIKKTLSKQPSNGIHVLKPDGLSPATNGLPPFPNPDTPAQNSDLANGKHAKEEEITFDPNGSYYMANACCELLHYRTAAILIGKVELGLMAVWGYFITHFYMATGGIDSIGSKISIGSQAVVAAGTLL